MIAPLWLALLLLDVAPAQTRREQTLEQLLRVLTPSRTPPDGRLNARDKTWEDWVRRTGELPPDFDAMPSVPGLPDPLLTQRGPVKSPRDWESQKGHLRAQIEHWMFGKFPPKPDNLRAVVTATRREGRVTIREVRLEFGPGHRASLRLELVIPDGAGPFPVFLTNHGRNRPWIYTAVRRGYIACVYHATDPRYGNGDDSDAWVEAYPDYDFSVLARWAWAASRAVDYLVTLPEVDKRKIGLTGHSRNGKQALLAAAFDERIGAVIPSSGNSGECDPWRYTTEPFVNESIELLTGAQSHWFHPRLRFFSGREDKLPVDQNTLLALVAPRGLMLYTGYAESASNPVGFEQAYRDALRVYRFLGKEQNIWLHLRDGEHETTAGDIEIFIDFLDSVFDRRPGTKLETWIHGYTFEGWQRLSGERIDASARPLRTFVVPPAKPELAKARQSWMEQIQWALGEEPPAAPNWQAQRMSLEVSSSEGWLAGLFGRPSANASTRDRISKEGMDWMEVGFGDGLKGDLFLPSNRKGEKLPVVVWLHPFSYQYGWSISSPWTSTGSDYRLNQRPSFPELTKRGFAVFAFDQIGFGARVRDAREFYARYPKWSLMGRMVADTRAVVDSLSAHDRVDASRIFLLGYSLGAKVGLIEAALDERVRGLAAVAGFDPLRLDTADRGVEGIRHYSHLHGLLPRLGFFAGQEARLPFDFDAALARIAPRRVLLVAPTLDRYARAADVRTEVEEARKAWQVEGRESAFMFDTPEQLNKFDRPMQQRVFDWLADGAR
ncbi:MAG TPA: alpha/beta fold hydrolase [Bryobacteraceae bacterium]|nr:alpha/beta fold hydrolase [Bryobacteraceae bacterium]